MAVLWIPLATIALRVREQGFWDDGGLQSRVWQRASAEKEGPEWQPISWCETWIDVHDGRRLEVVADGLPLFGGVQLAVDTTLVSPLHCDGTARRHTATVTELHSGRHEEGWS